ncbi:phage major capsid protein, P2 family [Ursidibacter sp. B-7004-1]
MNKTALELFTALVTGAASFYGADVSAALQGKTYSIDIPSETKLMGNIQQKSDFLQKINYINVKDIEGQLVFGATEKSITGRKKQGRYRQELAKSGYKYKLAETDSGILIPWQKADQWARYGDKFAELYADFVQRQIALDMIKIGFYGTSIAENTTAADLSDVNKGWLQFVRENKAENMIKQGKTASKIKIFGEQADFKNLDELAYQLKQGIGDQHRDGNDLVFVVGSDLIAYQSQQIYGTHALTPTERAALKTNELMSTFGGMPAITPPNMPGRLAFVTSLDNLSIYTQSGSIRRGMKDDEELKAIKDSYYRNEGYVVEDVTKFVGIEFANVKLPSDDDYNN